MTKPSRRRWQLPSLGMGAQLVALVLVLGLVSAMAIQPTRQLLAQQHRISATAHELHRTEQANHRLDVQIARLRNPDFIEEQARAQIGLVRPGETAYVVMPKPHKHRKNHKHGPRTRHDTHKRAAKNDGVIRGFLNFLGF
ncbi:MAG: Septum formation initiator [Actinomycetota bacterium]|nr:Septum formation initiator [Actinomycetota bacterium]